MFEFQSHLIFPVYAVPEPGPLPQGAEELSVTTADHEVVKGVYMPNDARASKPVLILGFGGNAWNGQDVAEYLHELYPDEDVAAFHYRGYPPSSGTPSADALVADAPLVHDAAVKRSAPSSVIGVGFSIGTAVAARLSTARKLDGLILVTPFDSLKALAQGMFPWLPIGPFFTHEIDAADALRGSSLPVALIAAQRDEIVPAERTMALRKAVPNIVFDHTINGAGHNDIYGRSEFQDAMRDALAAILKAA